MKRIIPYALSGALIVFAQSTTSWANLPSLLRDYDKNPQHYMDDVRKNYTYTYSKTPLYFLEYSPTVSAKSGEGIDLNDPWGVSSLGISREVAVKGLMGKLEELKGKATEDFNANDSKIFENLVLLLVGSITQPRAENSFLTADGAAALQVLGKILESVQKEPTLTEEKGNLESILPSIDIMKNAATGQEIPLQIYKNQKALLDTLLACSPTTIQRMDAESSSSTNAKRFLQILLDSLKSFLPTFTGKEIELRGTQRNLFLEASGLSQGCSVFFLFSKPSSNTKEAALLQKHYEVEEWLNRNGADDSTDGCAFFIHLPQSEDDFEPRPSTVLRPVSKESFDEYTDKYVRTGKSTFKTLFNLPDSPFKPSRDSIDQKFSDELRKITQDIEYLRKNLENPNAWYGMDPKEVIKKKIKERRRLVNRRNFLRNVLQKNLKLETKNPWERAKKFIQEHFPEIAIINDSVTLSQKNRILSDIQQNLKFKKRAKLKAFIKDILEKHVVDGKDLQQDARENDLSDLDNNLRPQGQENVSSIPQKNFLQEKSNDHRNELKPERDMTTYKKASEDEKNLNNGVNRDEDWENLKIDVKGFTGIDLDRTSLDENVYNRIKNKMAEIFGSKSHSDLKKFWKRIENYIIKKKK